MLSITDAIHELESRGLTRIQIAKDLGTSTTQIRRYSNGEIRNIGLKMAVKFWKNYEIQIMPYSIEELSGIHRKEENR